MSKPIFISGIGTGVGKTLVAAAVAEALGAGYWKPVQTGVGPGPGTGARATTDGASGAARAMAAAASDDSDTATVAALLSKPRVYPEVYRLALPASPHLAARAEGIHIDLDRIAQALPPGPLVIEGAGGLLVPLNEDDFMSDLIQRLDARVILVSRTYLGSINHSLLTARVAAEWGLDVIGWVFNDHDGQYEEEIARWSGLPVLGRIPYTDRPNAAFVREMAKGLAL